MKKVIIWLVVVIFTMSLAFLGIGCKEEATQAEEEIPTAEEAVEEAVAEEEAAPTEEAEGDVVAESPLNFTFIIYTGADTPVWVPTINGINEMSELLGINTDIQYADLDQEKQINIAETAINNKVDGIVMAVWVDDVFNDVIQKALDAGIGVIAYNVDDSRGEGACPRLSFIGQDFVESSHVLANEMIERTGLKEGDFVFCPVEIPTAVYAQKRYQGVIDILEPLGIGSELLETTTISLEENLTRETQYLLGHPETDAIFALGGMPLEVAPQAVEELGLDIPIGGYDLSPVIANDVKDGKIIGTIEQKMYLQGSLPVYSLWAYNKYGIPPCTINTGSLKFLDKSNIDTVVEFSGTYR